MGEKPSLILMRLRLLAKRHLVPLRDTGPWRVAARCGLFGRSLNQAEGPFGAGPTAANPVPQAKPQAGSERPPRAGPPENRAAGFPTGGVCGINHLDNPLPGLTTSHFGGAG